MFGSLQEKLSNALKSIRGRGVLTEAQIDQTMKAVRMALLEADVNFKVAKSFTEKVSERAKGQEVLKSLTPDQQIIKIVHEELIESFGGTNQGLKLNVPPPAIVLLVGLQGSGKTTTAGKLALLLKKTYKRRPYLVPADVYRLAAIEQLNILGSQIDIPVFKSTTDQDPVEIVEQAKKEALLKGLDTLIVDTAGRLQIDSELMKELVEIKEKISPHNILLVADAMTGQEAVNVAQSFNESLGLTGIILTKLDGDARGGAALSMKAVTGSPILFSGTGEKMDALELFHPERMASRVLGMGDVLTLIEKATQNIEIEDAEALQKKLKKGEFSLEDFLGQMKMIKKMGSLGSLIGMIPGIGKALKDFDSEKAESEMKRIEAIILSMTPDERRNNHIIDGSRRKRIAKGSGTSVEEVNRLLRQFTEMKKMMEKVSKMGIGGMMNMLKMGGR
jgi:signal recognition particle subunit SRP54